MNEIHFQNRGAESALPTRLNVTRHNASNFRAGRRQPPGSSCEGLRPRIGGLTPPRSDVSSELTEEDGLTPKS